MINNFEHQKEYDLTIAHMQIDNVVSKENPIILGPEQGFDKHSYLTAPEFTPFIQLKLSLTESDANGSIDTKVEALQFQIQGINLEIETGTLTVIIDNVLKIKNVFDDNDKKNKLSTKVPVSTSLKLSPGKKTVSKGVKNGNPVYVAIPIEEV